MLKACDNSPWNSFVAKCLFSNGVMLCEWCKSFSDCVNVITETVFTFLCTSIIMCFAQHVDINVLYLCTCIYISVILLMKWRQECVLSNGFVMQLLASPRDFFLIKYNHVQRKKEKMNFLLKSLIF